MTPQQTEIEFIFIGMTVISLFLVTVAGVLVAMWIGHKITRGL